MIFNCILLMFRNLIYEFMFNIWLHSFVYSLKLNVKMLFYHQSFMDLCFKTLFRPVVHVCEYFTISYRQEKSSQNSI